MLRIQNLELLVRHGSAAWLAHNRSLEAAVVAAEKELAAVRAAVADVNKTRKVQQLAAGAELARLEADWAALVERNRELRGVIARAEGEADVVTPATA